MSRSIQRAFRGDDVVPQDVCSFVLALALVYNDCKDTIYFHMLLTESQPRVPLPRTRAWGATAGARLHVVRMLAGIMNELFVLIEESPDVVDHPSFSAVVRDSPANARRAWRTLVDAARGRGSDEVGKLLV